jgi:hypothetical protein
MGRRVVGLGTRLMKNGEKWGEAIAFKLPGSRPAASVVVVS